MRASGRILVGLFVTALGASYWYVATTEREGSDATTIASSKDHPTRAPSVVGPMSDTGTTSVIPASVRSAGALSETGAPAGSLAEEGSLLTRAVSSADPEERAAAIETLGGSMSRDAIDTLGQVLTRDPSSGNRHLAIESLRAVAASTGDGDGSIRAVLRMATGDRDPSVGERASEAVREIDEFTSDAR